MWRCRCGTNVRAITEMDQANIDHPGRLNADCPKCGETQIIYGHRIVIVTGDNARNNHINVDPVIQKGA